MSQEDQELRPEVRWTLGCFVAMAALTGTLILFFLVAIALEPPTWVQVVLGVLLAAGGAALAWLVAAALGQRSGRPRPEDRAPERRDPRS